MSHTQYPYRQHALSMLEESQSNFNMIDPMPYRHMQWDTHRTVPVKNKFYEAAIQTSNPSSKNDNKLYFLLAGGLLFYFYYANK